MKTRLICAILAIIMISSMILVPTISAWSYGNPNQATDNLEEYFGPRANKIVIPFCGDQITEWQKLQNGNIDLTDWPLDDSHYAAYTTAPLNNSIAVFKYGPEFGLDEFDLDVNNQTYLDYPGSATTLNPRMLYANGVPIGNPMAELSLRQAVAYATDRIGDLSGGWSNTYIPVYTMLGANSYGISPWGKYTDFDITPPGARSDLTYPFNLTAANATLNAFPALWGYVGGYRGYKGQSFTIDIYAIQNDPLRVTAANQLGGSLTILGFNVVVRQVSLAFARLQVMANKDFSIYTGLWSLPCTPDFIIIWNYPIGYWDPGQCYDYGGINDAVYNTDSYNVMVANTQADAVFYAMDAQVEMASQVLMIPLFIAAGGKADSRTYTGGNNGVPVIPDDGQNAYRGKFWDGFVNMAGYGTDNGQSFLNMHPDGYDWGSGNMTIFYGFSTPSLTMLNPIYADTLWDNTVIDTCGYDSLVKRNPLNLGEFDDWAARNFTATTYNNPVLGICTKVVYTLRDDYFFQDGVPVTAADCYFTFVELKNDLAARGLAPPWWISNVLDVLDFRELDPCNFEVLYDVKSMFAIGWAGLNRILPKHIWKPIVTTGDPTTFAPDVNMIESGPWRLASYTETRIVLVANTPGSVVTTNIQGVTGSVPITSTQGYFRYLPIDVHTDVLVPPSLEYLQHLPDPSTGTVVNFETTYENLFADRDVSVHSTISLNGSLLTTKDWTLGHNGVYATSVTAIGFDASEIFTGSMLGYSYWNWNGTHLEYYKILWLSQFTAGNITWNGTVIATTNALTSYYAIIHDEFTFPGIAQLGVNLPLNKKFHYDIEWYMFSIVEDIGGTTWFDAVAQVIDPTTMTKALSFLNLAAYVYKAELPAPDGKVDGKDLAIAAKAFGTMPGDPRWSLGIADVNHDYKVDGKDLALIARKFGYFVNTY
jgi:ABC-type transport system substrate-binding protein